MKRIVLSLVLAIISICTFAQSEHVKFMGIPLNGTIQQFHQKLVAKGCRHDARTSSYFPNGSRAFNGSFAGNNADIYVYYDETSKIVYRAKAVITCDGKSIRDIKFNDIKNLLDTKYGALLSEKDTQDGYDSYFYPIYSEKTDEGIGWVTIYVSESDYSYNEYYIHVDYNDVVNTQKHDRKRLEDI